MVEAEAIKEKSTKNQSSYIPRISMRDFPNRKEIIGKQIIEAAETVGFFTLCDQAHPNVEEIEQMFEYSKKYFNMDSATKEKTPMHAISHQKGGDVVNTGYESHSQIRPSTGIPDMKESLQLQYHRRNINWPSDEDINNSNQNNPLSPSWSDKTASFIEACQDLSMDIMSCFASALSFPPDFFSKAHDINKDDAMSTLRLLHYPALPPSEETRWGAGPHLDFDCLTVLFQRTGGDGLEVRRRKKSTNDKSTLNGTVLNDNDLMKSFSDDKDWEPVPAKTGDIVVNIGDMLMSWSDDRFVSTPHRVKIPSKTSGNDDRYSIVWFNQANKHVQIQGPKKKYPAISGEEYIKLAMAKNYAALAAQKNKTIKVET